MSQGEHSMISLTWTVMQLLRPGTGCSFLRSNSWHRVSYCTMSGHASTNLSAGQDQLVHPKACEILEYWFGTAQWKSMPANYCDAERQKWWWTRSDAVDKEMTEKFGEDLKKAAAGGLADWQAGFNALAAVILMDQMSRNIYRNSAKMYALDAQALQLAQRLLNSGAAQQFVPFQRMWLLLPLMHSEKLEDQETVIQMATQLKEECEQMPDAEPLVKSFDNAADFGRKHRDVIKQWGRFPHRNVILGRDSTPAEEEGLRNKTIPSF